jgi:hypothetical protein
MKTFQNQFDIESIFFSMKKAKFEQFKTDI